MFCINIIITSCTVVAALQILDQLALQKKFESAATLAVPPSGAASSLPPDITAGPKQLQRRQEIVTIITEYQGAMSNIETVGSICGFVTGDIHWPVYCNEEQYCFTTDPYLECCSTFTQIPYTTTYYYTFRDTERNSWTTTTVSTQLVTFDQGYGSNCTTAYQGCYNYNDTATCTGSCMATALVCSDPYFPYCASGYRIFENGTTIGSSVSYGKTQRGVRYFCDTTAYGLEYVGYGQWPPITTTYTTDLSTSTTPTFTPNVVPFSRTQASSPASKTTLLGPISTSAAISSHKITPAAHMLATMSLLVFAICYHELVLQLKSTCIEETCII